MFAARNIALARKASSGGVVAFDSVGISAHALSSAGTPFTGSHTTVAAGATIYVDFMSDRPATLSSVTCGGSAMTLVGQVTLPTGASGAGFIARYKAVGVSAGAHTLSITSSVSDWYSWASVAYTGVGSEGSTQSNTGTGSSASHSATCAAGRLVLDAIGYYCTTVSVSITAHAGGTNRRLVSPSDYVPLCVSEASTATTFTATGTSVSSWAGMAHELIPA